MENKLRIEDYGNASILHSWIEKEKLSDIRSVYDSSKNLLRNLLNAKIDVGDNPLSLFFLNILINIFGERLGINHPENLLFSYTLNQENKNELQRILNELPDTINLRDRTWNKLEKEISDLYEECNKSGGVEALLLKMSGLQVFHAKLVH